MKRPGGTKLSWPDRPGARLGVTMTSMRRSGTAENKLDEEVWQVIDEQASAPAETGP